MIGELQVMNLYSVSWEVIHMTSKRLGALSPIYQGTIGVFYHHPLFPSSLPHGKHSSETWPFKYVVMDKVTAQLDVRVYTFVCMCVLFQRMYTPQRQRETRSSSTLSHPWGAIHQNWIWPWRAAVVLWCAHSPWNGPRFYCRPQGASRVVGLIRHADRWEPQGSLQCCPFVFNRHKSLWLPLRLVAPLTVGRTPLKLF